MTRLSSPHRHCALIAAPLVIFAGMLALACTPKKSLDQVESGATVKVPTTAPTTAPSPEERQRAKAALQKIRPLQRVRATVEVNGKVQEVDYHEFVDKQAKKLRIPYAIWNAKNGGIRISMTGQQYKLVQLVDHLLIGPVEARVDEVRMVEYEELE